MLYIDIPTSADLTSLANHHADFSVSIYLNTTPLSQDSTADAIELKNLVRAAVEKLEAAGADKRTVAAITESLEDLVDDYEFWRFQAHSLAIFATAENLRTFRLPNDLTPVVVVSDRFLIKPLLRSTTFANSGYVLALAEGSVRLVEVSADLPATEVRVDGLPRDARSAVGRATMINRSLSRVQGGEGQKILFRQFARMVDAALRPLLAGSNQPLILAANEPLRTIYRSVNTYCRLASATLDGGNDRATNAELAASARPILDALNQAEIDAFAQTFEEREPAGRASTDLAQIARAATFGAVDTLIVDIDEIIPGTIDPTDGSVTFGDNPTNAGHGIVDEITRRVLLANGRVIAARRQDIPAEQHLAAILRYAI